MDFINRFSEKLTSQAIRFVLIGSSTVGKTTLSSQFVNHLVDSTYERTDEVRPYRTVLDIGTNPRKTELVLLQIDDMFPINHPDLISNSKSINYQNMSRLFDSILENKRLNPKKKSGNPMFDEMPVHVYFFVFDVADRSSFEELEAVIEFVSQKEETRRARPNFKPTHKVLVANKDDLDIFEVPIARIEATKRKVEASFRKVSALDSVSVQDIFMEAARTAISKGLFIPIQDTLVSTEISADTSMISDSDSQEGNTLHIKKPVPKNAVRTIIRRCGCTGGDDCTII